MARALKAIDPKAARPARPKMLIFGKPGVGKTWAAIDFPSVYYIDTEGGADLSHYTDKLKAAGGAYFGPQQGSLDFHAVIEEVTTLATTKHPYKTLVIDSITKLFASKIAATAEALEKAGKKNEFGADKKPAVGLMRRLINWIDKIDMNCVLIAHERPVWANGEQAGTTADTWEKTEYELHLALNIVKQGASRKARVTKSRLLQFPDAEVFDWSFENFAEKFGREAINADIQVVSLASAEQIRQFNDLLSVVKVDPKVLEKWEENGDPDDLTSEDMQKRIAYLQKLIPAK
jgi:hypothetical protein